MWTAGGWWIKTQVQWRKAQNGVYKWIVQAIYSDGKVVCNFTEAVAEALVKIKNCGHA